MKIQYLTNIKASTKNFINTKFAKYYKLLFITLTKFFKLRLINEIMKENIIYVTQIIFVFENHFKKLFCLITSLIKFNIIFNIL